MGWCCKLGVFLHAPSQRGPGLACPQPAVSVPTEQQQRAVRESWGLRQELEEERARYQSLVQEYTRLEQGYENLRDEVAFHRVRGWQGHGRTRTNPPGFPVWSGSAGGSRAHTVGEVGSPAHMLGGPQASS